jgi:hypothetical protein
MRGGRFPKLASRLLLFKAPAAAADARLSEKGQVKAEEQKDEQQG